jgi:DNA-binding HxlR family transcriptional regulator
MHEEHDELFCPFNATLDLLNARWTLHIVRALLDGKKRFNELSRANCINPRTLRERLKSLEEQGVISRTVVSTLPPNVEYALTEKGKELNAVFEAMSAWGVKWVKPPEEKAQKAEPCVVPSRWPNRQRD